jgi:hypothetical protein
VSIIGKVLVGDRYRGVRRNVAVEGAAIGGLVRGRLAQACFAAQP